MGKDRIHPTCPPTDPTQSKLTNNWNIVLVQLASQGCQTAVKIMCDAVCNFALTKVAIRVFQVLILAWVISPVFIRRRLKQSIFGAFTTVSGRQFQMVAILRLKKYLRLLRFDALLLNNFLEWPLVFCVYLTLRQIWDNFRVIYSWYYFVRFNHVPRTLLYVSVGRPSSLSHWSYGKFLKPGINFVALFCTCSIVSISCFWCGIHTKLDTSRCGLTMLMYSCMNVFLSI